MVRVDQQGSPALTHALFLVVSLTSVLNEELSVSSPILLTLSDSVTEAVASLWSMLRPSDPAPTPCLDKPVLACDTHNSKVRHMTGMPRIAMLAMAENH